MAPASPSPDGCILQHLGHQCECIGANEHEGAMEGYQRIELAVRRSGFGDVGDTGMEAVMRRSRYAIEIGLKSNWGRLFRHTLTLTGDVDNARDLIQQSALYALASSSAPSDPTPARAWLFKIVAMPGSTNIADKR